MATCKIKFKVSLAWWWWPYLYGVACMAYLTGLQPDMVKVHRVTCRAIRVKVI